MAPAGFLISDLYKDERSKTLVSLICGTSIDWVDCTASKQGIYRNRIRGYQIYRSSYAGLQPRCLRHPNKKTLYFKAEDLIKSVASSNPASCPTNLPEAFARTLSTANVTMQGTDGPVLELSEIMHTMSPSPAPQTVALPLESQAQLSTDVDVPAPHGNDLLGLEQVPSPQILDTDHPHWTPEPLDYSELEGMKQRVQQLTGLTRPNAADSTATTLERELVNMVVRLTSYPTAHPSSSQLASQAETIAELTTQRNLLLHERDEEHARWKAERQGWERSAEALIGKRRAARDAAGKDYESERALARLKDDNHALRHKLSNTNTRLSVLEAELAKARPLLLTQSNLLRDENVLVHMPFLHLLPPLEDTGNNKKSKRKKSREKEVLLETKLSIPKTNDSADTVEVVNDDVSVEPADASAEGRTFADADVRPQDLIVPSGFAQEAGPSRQRTIYKHVTVASNSRISISVPTHHPSRLKGETKSEKKSHYRQDRTKISRARRPLMSDARAECLLTAARRLGRVRASTAAGLIKERELKQQRAKVEEEARHVRAQAEVQSCWAKVGEGQAGPSNYAARHETGSSADADANATPNGANAGTLTARAQARGIQGQVQQQQTPPGPYQAYGVAPFMYIQAVPSPPSGRAVPAQVSQAAMMIPVWPIPGQGTQGTPPGRHQATNPSFREERTSARNEKARAAPSTPLDELLSAATAARTLMVDEDAEDEGETEMEDEEELQRARRSPRRQAAAALDSPVSKKRRTGASISRRTRGWRQTKTTQAQEQSKQSSRKGKGKRREQESPAVQPHTQGKGKAKASDTNRSEGPSALYPRSAPPIMRVRSGLDVLADQAAQQQERMPASEPGSRQQSSEPEERRRQEVQRPQPMPMWSSLYEFVLPVKGPEDPGPEPEEGVDTDIEDEGETAVDTKIAGDDGGDVAVHEDADADAEANANTNANADADTDMDMDAEGSDEDINA